MLAEDRKPVKDIYQFGCTMCGNCCTGLQTVRMDLYDLYRLAGYLDFADTALLFRQGIVTLTPGPHSSYIPILRFKVKPLRVCPFLEHTPTRGLCRLHPVHKPLVCSMAPLARAYTPENGNEDWFFVKPAPDCPGVNEHKEQRLADFKKTHRQQLAYQTRYYNLMQQIVHKAVPEQVYRDQLYSFKTDRPFEFILSRLEAEFSHYPDL